MQLTSPESLIFWTTIIFVVFFILLAKFAWKPILGAVKSREESINNALASAEAARREMQNLTADNERILQEARMERDALLKEARDMKDKMIADSKHEAQVQGSAREEERAPPSGRVAPGWRLRRPRRSGPADAARVPTQERLTARMREPTNRRLPHPSPRLGFSRAPRGPVPVPAWPPSRRGRTP